MYIVFSLESKLNNVKINLDFGILEMFLEKQEHRSKKNSQNIEINRRRVNYC